MAERALVLPPEKRTAVTALHVLNPWGNLRILEFLAIWVACGVIALRTDVLTVRLGCYFLAGATLQGFGILMHEGVHGLMFRNRRLNRWLGFITGLPALLSISAYRAGHLPHHRYERGAKDPDELENLSRDPRILAGLFCLTVLAGDLFGFYRIGPWNAVRAKPRERRDIVLEYAIIVALVATAITLVPGRVLLHAWFFPALVARQLTNVRTVAEHALTPAVSRPSTTRTIVSNAFVSYFMCNLNYHIEHHLYPGVPWYNLPKLHDLLRPELRAAGGQFYRSYTQFLRELLGFVCKAWSPGGNRLALELPVRAR